MSSTIMVKCRLCLVETDIDKMYELFKNNDFEAFKTEADQKDEFSNLKLYEKVEYCCGVRLHNKQKLPTRICSKCFNMIHMWFNFRQMCFNSQVFLNTQYPDALGIHQELENMQSLRNKIKQSAGQEKDHNEFQELIDFEIEPNEEELIESHYDDDDDYIPDNNDNTGEGDYDSDTENAKIESMAEYYSDQGDLLKALTPEDYDEALAYLNADEDQDLEEFIEHCATKNVAIRQLKAKAMSRFKVKTIAKPGTKEVKKEKLPKPSTFMCNICGNVYSKKPLFQHHMRMHSDVKPYQCEICNKSFRIMSDLRNHMYRHTGEKPFKCKHCDRHFMDRSSRHRHERVHTNSRPYTCPTCNKSFTYSAILKNHMKLHSGEKDYICSICNKQFTLAHQLKAHMLTISHKQKEAAFEASGYKIIYEGSGI